jgi:hypothetical protein
MRVATVRRREACRPQAGIGRLKPAPPMQANVLPTVAQAVSPANSMFSQILREWSSPASFYRAPCFFSSVAVSAKPLFNAAASGVMPALFAAFTSAPRSINNSTTGVRPQAAA